MQGKRTWVSEARMLQEELVLVPGRDKPDAADSGPTELATERKEESAKRQHDDAKPMAMADLRLRLNRARRSALCLSGGGIRSSSFCLGVMQQLARFKVLDDFSFLSTVSGGGFAGSWLSSRRSKPVVPCSNEWPSANTLMSEANSTAPLRDVSRYLAMDADDTWELAGVFLLSLVINWLALLPLIVAAMAGLMLTPQSWRLPALASLALCFLAGSLYIVLVRVGEGASRFRPLGLSLEDIATQLQVRALKYLVVLGIGLAIVNNQAFVMEHALLLAAPLGTTGLLGLLTLALRAFALLKTTTRVTGAWISAAAALIHVFLLILATRLLIVAQAPALDAAKWVIARSAALSSQPALQSFMKRPDAGLWACLVLAVVISLAVAWIDPNRISLHDIFRRRIGRAFVDGGPDVPMTGGQLQAKDGSLRLSRWLLAPGLYQVINATANDPSGRGATQAERRGHSFVFTPLHCGFTQPPAPVSAPTDKAGPSWMAPLQRLTAWLWPSRDPSSMAYVHRNHVTSMAASLAVSGAAVSPQMGSFGSTLLSLPLTLMNLRLGFWLRWPNPSGRPGMPLWLFNVLARVYEAYPFFKRRHGHLYLTDGGHFDNLGLYEMVRRRCRHILVIDGGRDVDRSFGSLANAIRRVRADFDIRIAIGGLDSKTRLPMYSGTIYYSEVNPDEENGLLVYIRPETRIHEPADVWSYAREHKDFPNESTADQSFGESQFESYRGLGNFIIADAMQKYMNWKGPVAILPESAGDMVRFLAEVASEMLRGISVADRAGGIIHRPGNGGLEVLLTDSVDLKTAVLPKGRVESGEYLQETAVREIEEETGYRFSIDPARRVTTADYSRDGRTIHVAYFHFAFDSDLRRPDRSKERENRGIYWLPINALDATKPVTVGEPNVVTVPPDVVQLLLDFDKTLAHGEALRQDSATGEQSREQEAPGPESAGWDASGGKPDDGRARKPDDGRARKKASRKT